MTRDVPTSCNCITGNSHMHGSHKPAGVSVHIMQLQHGAPMLHIGQTTRPCTQGPGGKTKNDKKTGGIAIQQPYLHVVGMDEEAEGAHSLPTFTCAPASVRFLPARSRDCSARWVAADVCCPISQ